MVCGGTDSSTPSCGVSWGQGSGAPYYFSEKSIKRVSEGRKAGGSAKGEGRTQREREKVERGGKKK